MESADARRGFERTATTCAVFQPVPRGVSTSTAAPSMYLRGAAGSCTLSPAGPAPATLRAGAVRGACALALALVFCPPALPGRPAYPA